MTMAADPPRERLRELASYFFRLGGLFALFRWKVGSPLLGATSAAGGLIAFPLLRPGWLPLK